MFLLIEFGLCILAVLIAIVAPNLGGSLFSRIEQLLTRLARHRGWAVFTVGMTALILRAALLPVEPIPQPQIHDEFSYLLMGDTFAHGRLANPTHPMWVHFETFHVNQQPRYVSMFYPAQGVFLAIGQVLFGHPFWGVWLSVGIMCAAICWMLQAWVPPLWALLGGLLVVMRLGTFSYWANSYWGGAVAAIGGALVLGSFPRITRDCRKRDSMLLGLGFSILAASRPYEGLLYSVPFIVRLMGWILARRVSIKTSFNRLVLPLSLGLGFCVAGMIFYFWRTTGHPFLSPYMVQVRTYNPVPYFPWQRVGPTPQYDHQDMKDFYLGWWLGVYHLAREHPLQLALMKGIFFWTFFLGSLFSLPLIAFILTLGPGLQSEWFARRVRFLLFVTFSTLVGLALPIYMNVHYAAPLTGAIYLFVVLAFMRIRKWDWHGKRRGVALVRSVFAVCVFLFLLKIGDRTLHRADYLLTPTWSSQMPEMPGRQTVLRNLNSRPGKLLALVRYRRPRERDQEPFGWIYNAADIDRSKIVWAYDMGSDKNKELLDYYPDREVWRIEPDEIPAQMSLLRAASTASAPELPKERSLGATSNRIYSEPVPTTISELPKGTGNRLTVFCSSRESP